MRERRVVSLLLGALAVVAVLATAATASSPAPVFSARMLTVRGAVGSRGGPVLGLALDGIHAAYVAGAPAATCGFGERVYRWDLSSGRSSAISGHRTCSQDQTSTGRGVFELALAGARTTWLVNSGGNTESGEMLLSSTATPGKDALLARSGRIGGDLSTLAGTWIGGLASDGSRISYGTWSTRSDQTVTASALWRISGPAKTAIAHGTGAMVSASADQGRIAVLRPDATVAVYGINGKILKTITASPAKAVALTGKLLAVLTKADTIEVYNRASGALLHRWPNAGGTARQFDAYGGIGVFVRSSRVHAIDLSTGKNVVVATRTRPILDVKFDQPGLLYDYNLSWTAQEGKIVFVPLAAVTAKLGL